MTKIDAIDFSEDFMPLRKLILDGSNKKINHFLFDESNRPIRDSLFRIEPGIIYIH